jgi:UDP-N-acetylglucosamine 2-epimerase
LVVHHPIGRGARTEQQAMTHILGAVRRAALCGLIVHPNTDRGHSGIVRAIREAERRQRCGQWVATASMPRQDFLCSLKAARVLVGNSSAGIIEAPSAGTPAVNVGRRQERRLRGGPAIIDCGESARAVGSALNKALALRVTPPRRSVYGNGDAGLKIAALLARVRMSDNLRRKQISY